MRPPGELRQALCDGLALGPATTRELAMRTCMGLDAARWTLDNMRRGGLVQVVDQVRVPGVRRPVPVYGRASEQAKTARAAVPHEQIDWSLVRCWAQFPAAG